jgi:hypothetical protein
MANICDCVNNDCPLIKWCKRGLKMYQGEPIDFKHICNMDTRYRWIELIKETIEKSEV